MGMFEARKLQHAGPRCIAFQNSDLAPFAGRGIGRIGLERDNHHLPAGVAETFHDLGRGIFPNPQTMV